MADLGKTLIGGDLTVIDDTILGGSLFIIDKLGVGIKTPTEVLDIVGNIKLTGDIKTSSLLNIYDSGGAYTGVKASSLVLSSSAGSYTAPSNGAYIQGNVGIGRNPSYKLDVSGDIRASGQFRSTVTGSTPPIITSSSALVTNLNSDKLDNYEAKDIFNSIIDVSGYGVIEGLKVTAVENDTKVNVETGIVLIKDYGVVSVPGQSYGGFTGGLKHIVFVAGKTATEGGKNLTAGQIAVVAGTSSAYPSMSIFTNPIVIAKVDLPSSVTMSNSYIYPSRKFSNIIYSTLNDNINIFTSDRDSVSVGSSSIINRINIKPNGDSTLLTISNVPNPISPNDKVLKEVSLAPDRIRFNISGTGQQSITYDKIIAWDDAESKKHTHVYDGSYVLDATGKILTIDTSFVIPNPNTVRVYINGLRRKKDSDYIMTAISPKVILTFSNEILISDNIVVDYDL